jgi:hypothetical protein
MKETGVTDSIFDFGLQIMNRRLFLCVRIENRKSKITNSLWLPTLPLSVLIEEGYELKGE